MGQIANLYGPPGTGKTHRLMGIAEAVVREHGPASLAFVTFTRAGALEIKRRLAPGVDERRLSAMFPYVGTIHSICFRLIGGGTVVTNAHKRAWALDAGDRLATFSGADRVDWLDTYDIQDEPTSDAQWALQILSAARQRGTSIEQACRVLDPPLGPDRIAEYVASYEAFKRDNDLIDFEDMLVEGGAMPLPVKYLLVDEAQDNSVLLWRTIERWRASIPFTVQAGDPWQAIYIFNGADPYLFRSQPGGWQTIGDSRRLTSDSADYARRVLLAGGVESDPLFETWDGAADGSEREGGSAFYLARTNALVNQIAQQMLLEGTPYAYLNGRRGPLGLESTRAFRAVVELRETGSVDIAGVNAIVKERGKAIFGEPEVKRWAKAARERGDQRIALADLSWGNQLDRLARGLDNYDYLATVVSKYGYGALAFEPKNKIGTIHSAKGREADYVNLVTCWGSRPGEAAASGDVGEACVAYVGTSRHRSELRFHYLPRPYGIEFPFPSRMARAS